MASSHGSRENSQDRRSSKALSLENWANGTVTHEDGSLEDLDEADDGDLFGESLEDNAVGDEPVIAKRRKLDDEELDSGDDEGRHDRLADNDMDGYGREDDEERETRTQNVMDVRLPRHPIPRPSDGELYLFQFPKQLGVESKPFHHSTFQPPSTDHHSDESPSSTFSSYATALNTIRWRYSPSNPLEIQSNARILRWSDGSLTLQLAANPREQYVLGAKALAPPQSDPPKPVPTVKNHSRTANGSDTYNASLDAHTYLVSPHEGAQVLRITNHITATLGVQTNTIEDDEALVRLQERMAAAKGNKIVGEGGVEMLTVREDPELAKLKAEAAEKEKIKAQRKRQQQEERERDRANRVLGRSGLRTGSYGMGGGLTVGGLEDDDGMATTRPSRANKPKKKPRRRNSEYSEDEDFRHRGRTREDEYDEDDGFLVGSDEEPEIVADDSEEEPEEFGEEDAEGDLEEENPVAKAPPSSKRDADDAAAGARVKRRRVIDEDEDED